MLSNSSFIQNKSFFTLALFTLCTFSSTSCSLKAVGDGDSSGVASIVIRIPGLYSKQHTLTPYEGFLNFIGLSTTNAALPPPASINDFKCYMVNVMGGGIPKNPNDNKGGGQPMQIDPSWSAEKKRSCSTYPGFVSKLVPANQGGELTVDGFTADHVGKNVIVQVIGIQDSNVGCPNMTIFEAEKSLGAQLMGMYELGRANAQINAGINNISVNNSFTAANANDRTIGGEMCGGGGGATAGGCPMGQDRIALMFQNNSGGTYPYTLPASITGCTSAQAASANGCPVCPWGGCIQPIVNSCVKLKLRLQNPDSSPKGMGYVSGTPYTVNNLNLSGTGVQFYYDSNCSATVIGNSYDFPSFNIWNSQVDSGFLYAKILAGTWTMNASSSAGNVCTSIANSSLVAQPAPTPNAVRLVDAATLSPIISPQTLITGECKEMKVQSYDTGSGITSAVNAFETINVSSTSSSFKAYSSAGYCSSRTAGTTTQSASITASNSESNSFWISLEGMEEINSELLLNGTSLGTQTLNYTVTRGTPTLQSSGSASTSQGACFPISVKMTNSYGGRLIPSNISFASSGTGDCANATFWDNPSCTGTNITSGSNNFIGLPVGSLPNSKKFYMKAGVGSCSSSTLTVFLEGYSTTLSQSW